jgi:hypothetical protein
MKKKTKTEDKDMRTLDIMTHEVGLLEMKDGRTTPDDRRWAEGVATSMRERIAEHRRSRLPKSVPIEKAEPLTERLLAMPRALLEVLYASLAPRAQIAHRHLETLSDNDLRRIIQTIESHTKRR